ncbi:MAG: T9SS type A sorting domain-containing protein [Saprospiraceae bacterium]|nr:T9SS type A sorting domain-containing protein [Saprospiraceae bacterium]
MRLKPHFLFAFFCLFSFVLNAQTPVCQPDTVKYRDSTSGVYPLPYVATTRPNGGINKPACIGKSYNFVWTVKLGDTVTVPYNGSFVQAPIDSVVINTSGAIEGLPAGITYACNPANCNFKKKSYGCVVLTGTPTSANAIKAYPLKMSGRAYLSGIFALFNPVPLTFPGTLAEGTYDLNLYAANDSRCTTAAEDLTEVSSIAAVPNPTNGKTTIRIESTIADKFDFTMTDLLGRTVVNRPLSIQAGLNTLDLDVSNLSNGIYIYNLSKGNRVISNKLIVNQ